jgi:DNA-binding Lrp family transcriptional regulator
MGSIDELDARVIALMRSEPRIGVSEIARRVGAARGTVQARLEKLVERGVIASFGPEVDPTRMGYPILAFVFLELAQGRLEEAVEHLSAIPEVLEAHGTSGTLDLLCRVAARDTEHLQIVIGRMLDTSAVQRSTSHVALSRQIPLRCEPLVDQAWRPR